jgi:hypothetical protein
MTNTKPAYWKSNEEIALLLTLRPGRTDAAREVSAKVLARVEAQIGAK